MNPFQSRKSDSRIFEIYFLNYLDDDFYETIR